MLEARLTCNMKYAQFDFLKKPCSQKIDLLSAGGSYHDALSRIIVDIKEEYQKTTRPPNWRTAELSKFGLFNRILLVDNAYLLIIFGKNCDG